MPAELVFAGSVILVALAFRGTLRVALAVTIVATVLIPGTLVIPNGFTSYLTVQRMVSAGLLINLLLRVWQGEIGLAVLRPRRVHALLALLLLVGLVNGVALGAAEVPTGAAYQGLLLVLDQIVFLVAVLGCMRAIDDDCLVAYTVFGAVAAVALVAAWEWTTEESWAELFIADLPEQQASAIAQGLEVRGGDVTRIRGPSAFALEFGWLLTLLFPLVFVVASRARRTVWVAVPSLVALAVYWTNSRSAVLGLAVGAVLLVALTRFDWRVTRVVAAAGIVVVALVVVAPSVRQPFTVAAQTGSIDVRMPNLKAAVGLTADDPYTGLGFRGLAARGVPAVDTSYALVYAELGVLGLVVFLAVVVGGIGSTFPALRAPPGRRRAVAGAAVTGALLTAMATGAFGLFSRPAPFRAFWLLVALGMVLGERHQRTTRGARSRPGVRLLLPVAGIVVGFAVSATVRGPSAETLYFDIVPAQRFVASTTPFGFPGNVLVDTVCEMAPAIATADVECHRVGQSQDLGRLRIQDDRSQVRATVSETIATLSDNFPSFTAHRWEGLRPAHPTWARTAPVTLPLAGILAALLTPPVPLRRLRASFVASYAARDDVHGSAPRNHLQRS